MASRKGGQQQGKKGKTLEMSKLAQDATWKQSWAGKVYSAIVKLHSQPDQFMKLVDRVESDLVSEVLTPDASKKKQIIACIKGLSGR